MNRPTISIWTKITLVIHRNCRRNSLKMGKIGARLPRLWMISKCQNSWLILIIWLENRKTLINNRLKIARVDSSEICSEAIQRSLAAMLKYHLRKANNKAKMTWLKNLKIRAQVSNKWSFQSPVSLKVKYIICPSRTRPDNSLTLHRWIINCWLSALLKTHQHLQSTNSQMNNYKKFRWISLLRAASQKTSNHLNNQTKNQIDTVSWAK